MNTKNGTGGLRLVRNGFENLRVVILDCPYDTWANPIVQELFPKIVDLKFVGYRGDYPYGVIPVDTYDFVGSHHLVCKEENGKLKPIMGYKTVTYSRVKMHNLLFPALAILNASGSKKHVDLLSETLARCEKQGTEIAYDGSWTIHPDVRKDKEFSGFLKELLMGINVNYHLERKTSELIGFGMIRFKTDKYFNFFGYEPFQSEGSPLPSIHMNTLQNEPAVAMHLQKFSPAVLETARRFKSYWDSRLLIASPQQSEWKVAS